MENLAINGVGVKPYRVLLADDDGVLLESLQEQLLEKGYIVDIALSVSSVLRISQQNRYDAFVLDINFGDGNRDGRDVCRELRERGEGGPILIMTALDGVDDELKGLGAGANDYIHKPVRFELLEARVRAHIERYKSANDEVIKLQGFSFVPFEKKITCDNTGKSVKLTEKETMILNHLIKARGGTVSRSEFLERVWQYQSDTNTHTLETHIYRLRKKISVTGGDPDSFLRTDMGGYRIIM